MLTARHYLYRHLVLFGDKYDSVIIDQKDLDAMAYLATLPGARDTLIGDSNVDGTAWMYAVADLHPLWTHYDFPQQTGPGYYRFIFWAYADADAYRGYPMRAALVRGDPGAQYSLHPDQHPDGPGVQGARRTSVTRQIEVVGEDLRQRWGPNLRMARRPGNSHNL